MIYKDNKERLCLQFEVPRYYELYVSHLCLLVNEVSLFIRYFQKNQPNQLPDRD